MKHTWSAFALPHNDPQLLAVHCSCNGRPCHPLFSIFSPALLRSFMSIMCDVAKTSPCSTHLIVILACRTEPLLDSRWWKQE
mmetsp:Transcript_39560/g.101594  ORF Transcript_39560/g.101594 Transcript_39560/m.101594 type:complete len:82 (+) Transcript_39560:1140-1385(+)